MKIFSLLIFITFFNLIQAQDITKVYTVPAARQGVAVDADHFYVINNSTITKHDKKNGRLVTSWEDKDSVLNHMNSGIIIEGKLYCINSSYPELPMASSLEVFDPETLTHIDNHSFGILNGSATWIDKYNDFWYVAFAHYSGKGGVENKTNAWTELVKFDSLWRQTESWIFPNKLLEKFGNNSTSGGVILPDGKILCTGHDNFEIYLLEFPAKGFTLNWIDTFSVGSYGQGIALEKSGGSELIYGIIRNENKVVITNLKRISD
jgi:hypothetical protein